MQKAFGTLVSKAFFVADNIFMKRLILIFSLLLLSFSLAGLPKPVLMEIKLSRTQSFPAYFYPFNSIEEGDSLCKEKFKFSKLDYTLKKEKFTRVTFIDPTSELLKYEYCVMKNGFEFWVFKNPGDGHLWGKGFLLPRE